MKTINISSGLKCRVSPARFQWLNAVLLCTLSFVGISKAELLHHYTFDGTDPYEDKHDGADLTEYGSVGIITVDPGGFLSFSGTDTQDDTIYLGGDALNQVFEPFVLSLWFRTPTVAQSEYTSLFSSNADTTAGFQINFRNGFFGINMNGVQLEVLPLTSLTTNEWHMVTVMQDPNTMQGQIWLDDFSYTNSGSFGELNSFRLGVNRAGRQGFFGDIAEVSIYNNETWDTTRQDETFAAGPAIPEPASMTLVLLVGISSLWLKRVFS